MTIYALTLLAQLASPDICQNAGEMGRTIMTARNLDIPISEVLGLATHSELITGIIIVAYSQPRVPNGFLQANSFGKTVEKACRGAIGGKNGK